MDRQLLAIHTQRPPRSSGLIDRARLLGAIENACEDAKVVLISAPAGYGKTTLLIEWAHATSRPVAWVNVEPELNDPEQLLRYLATAWASVDPELLVSPVGLLLESNDPDPDLVTRAMANYALLANRPIAFALDDLHLIQDPATSQMLAFLVEHLPAEFRFVCAARSEPHLPLSRMRVRQHMKEIGTAELAFGLEETKRLFTRARAKLSDHDLAVLQNRYEGWVAGLQLMAQSGAPMASAGDPRAITDYLSDEVLAVLDGETRRCLMQVSILDQLCASLCDAVTGGNDSRAMLGRLERANLFLQPLDAERAWYRLHPLMREALRREMETAPALDVPALHARAGQWFFQQGMIDEAFQHAVAGGDQELTAHIAERYAVMKIESGEFRTIQRWVEAVPQEWYRSTQELNIMPIVLSVFSGDVEAGLKIMDEVEAHLVEEDEPNATRLGAKMAVGRCAVACFQDQVQPAEAYAARALRDLADEDVTFRANTHHALADTYRRHGRWDEARRHYLQALESDVDPSVPRRSAHVYGALADLALRQGHLHEAASFWRKDIASIQRHLNWGKLPVPIIGWAYIRHGELLYEWNRIDEAQSELERGLERAELGGDARALIAGYLLAARVRLVAGDLSGADGYLQRSEDLVERAPYPEWRSTVDRARALVWVQRGDGAEALAWCRRVRLGADLRDRPDNQASYLGLAHVLIAFGTEADRAVAQSILADQFARAEAEGRLGVQAEVLALEALELQASGYETKALVAIERALRIAEPEGPVRLFLDLGAPLLRLLRRAEARGALPTFGQRLLEAAADSTSSQSSQLIEQLSDRELEILRLVAAGLTNREAGERLFISDETVKKHLSSIYGKLSVHRRTEAAARARELGLLR
jgi:LuxR family transcriptional regulator, maltose regulon positive regulatory protein